MQRTQRISGDDFDSKVWTLPDILGGFPHSWQYFLLFNEFHVRIQWLGLEDEDRKQSLWIDICNKVSTYVPTSETPAVFLLTKWTTQKRITWIRICFKTYQQLLSWPIFVQCVSKPPRFCFSWWILVTETAQRNLYAAQSLAFGARINLGFCPICATTQVDTMQLHCQIHKFTSHL